MHVAKAISSIFYTTYRWGPKSQPVVTLKTPRLVPCDRCWWVGRNCFSWKKGPETLIACAACFKVKMSCKTRGDGVQGRKQAKTLVRKTRKDSTAEDVESKDMEEDGKARGGKVYDVETALHSATSRIWRGEACDRRLRLGRLIIRMSNVVTINLKTLRPTKRNLRQDFFLFFFWE